MEEKVRAKLTRNKSVSKLPDVEKIKREAREEAEAAFQKKTTKPCRGFELKFENRRCYLHIVKR